MTTNELKFQTGRLEVTPGVVNTIPAEEGEIALERHQTGDWGDCGNEVWERNEDNLREGGDLLSVYHTAAGIEYWIITSADRTTTRVLLPEEYSSPGD